ncbi:hypothetical protein D3C85_630890 [compost metagenome]
MTFEELVKQTEETHCNDELVISLMQAAWNAAKQDKESDKELVFVEYSGIVGDWVVRDYQGVAIEDGFYFNTEAEKWSIENGYRLK